MIRAKRKSGFQTVLTDRHHTLVADVGPENGGDDAGPSPHTLLEAALAACTSITVEMYAKRKGWPLDAADVEVSILSEGRKTFIARKVRLSGALEEDMRARLMDIAEKCPVHRILLGEVEIETTPG